MRKQAETMKPMIRKPKRKQLTAEESVERMNRVAEWRKPRLRAVALKEASEKRSPRATVSREQSIERLSHLEEFVDEWIKNYGKGLASELRQG
jgi:hypothetical protein